MRCDKSFVGCSVIASLLGSRHTLLLHVQNQQRTGHSTGETIYTVVVLCHSRNDNHSARRFLSPGMCLASASNIFRGTELVRSMSNGMTYSTGVIEIQRGYCIEVLGGMVGVPTLSPTAPFVVVVPGIPCYYITLSDTAEQGTPRVRRRHFETLVHNLLSSTMTTKQRYTTSCYIILYNLRQRSARRARFGR